MSQHYFTIPPKTALAVARGDDAWSPIRAMTSLGVDAEPGQPVRIEIVEGAANHRRILDTKPKGIALPFRMTFPNGRSRLFSGRIITTVTEGKALVSVVEIEGTVQRITPGVEANFPDPMRTGAGGNARDLPEMGV